MLQKAPPDGGYGWVIVFANALSNFIATPLMHCFGMIFNDTFKKLGMTATQCSLIINLNAAFGMMTGLINGYLLKTLGCRKIAILGSTLLTLGVVCTAYSRNFQNFLISYGLITSLGMGLCQSAFGLAVNLYFKERRNFAVGISETLTGFGPIVIPQIISILLMTYTPEEVTLIFGGICGNVYIGAMLLQPVQWHMRKIESTTDELVIRIPTTYEYTKEKSCLQKAIKSLDLDLIKDPIFLNITLGLAIAIFAELNFTILTSFMLHDYGLITEEIAIFLSTLGGADIVFRFFAPYIGLYFTTRPRWMYTYSLFLLMITRFTFLLSTNFHVLIVIALGLGIAKGIRKVYMSLVIPDYVKSEQLAIANGLEMMMNGFCIIIGGPLLGVVRDATGGYSLCIIIMNCVTFTTISMWITEVVVLKYRNLNKQIAIVI